MTRWFFNRAFHHWRERGLEGARELLRSRSLDYMPDRARVSELLHRYFVGPITDAQIDELAEETRRVWHSDPTYDYDWQWAHLCWESPTSWLGAAWHEEFTHGSREMTRSDLLLMLADKQSAYDDKGQRFSDPKLYCPPEFIGTWELLEPREWLGRPAYPPDTPGPTRFELGADGRFRSNTAWLSHERLPYWGVIRHHDHHQGPFWASLRIVLRAQRHDRLGTDMTVIRNAYVIEDQLNGHDDDHDAKLLLRRVTPAVDAIAGQLVAGDAERCRVFTAYVVDPRDSRDVEMDVERAFDQLLYPIRGEVVEPGGFRVGAEVFGADLTLERVNRWPEGDVYRIAMGTRYDRPPPEDHSVTYYLSALLRHAGFAKVIAEADYERWDRELRGHRFPPPVVRSAEEAMVYMEAHPCAMCGDTELEYKSRLDDVDGTLVTLYEGTCFHCGAFRRFELALDDALPPPHTDDAIVLGEGPSRALDVAQLAGVAARVLEDMPEDSSRLDPADRDRLIYRLRLAVGAVDTALPMAQPPERDVLLARRAELARHIAELRH